MRPSYGSPPRPVSAYNRDGSLYKHYTSIMEAVRDINGHQYGITIAANGKPIKRSNGKTFLPKSYKGLVWKWN